MGGGGAHTEILRIRESALKVSAAYPQGNLARKVAVRVGSLVQRPDVPRIRTRSGLRENFSLLVPKRQLRQSRVRTQFIACTAQTLYSGELDQASFNSADLDGRSCDVCCPKTSGTNSPPYSLVWRRPAHIILPRVGASCERLEAMAQNIEPGSGNDIVRQSVGQRGLDDGEVGDEAGRRDTRL